MTEPVLFSAEDLRRRAAERLSPGAGEATGDHTYNPDIAAMLLAMERQQAAVLVPVIDHGHTATLLFTERTGALRHHAGQPPHLRLRQGHPGGGNNPDHGQGKLDQVGCQHPPQT